MPDNTGKKQLPDEMKPYQFKPGQSGNPNGRPKGARSKLTEAFINALAEDFAENGVQAIISLRNESPKDYIVAVGKLVPKEFDLEHSGGVTINRLVGIGRNPDSE